MKPFVAGLTLTLLTLTIVNTVRISSLRKDLVGHSQYSMNQHSNNLNHIVNLYNVIQNHKYHIERLWTNSFPVINPMTNNQIGGKSPEIYYK